MNPNSWHAPGAPGIPPRWTSSAKIGVGTARNLASNVWFTLSHGIFDEIYYPRVDQACVRDMGMIVTGRPDFFSEEKRDTRSEVRTLAPGVPAYEITNTCRQDRYRIEKEVLTDPHRAVVLQRTRFVLLQGDLADHALFVLLAPHLANRGLENTAWVGTYKGMPMLFAERDDTALALACSVPWRRGSAGFVGVSDGWQDLSQHRRLTWNYQRAENGNVALTGEVDLSASGGSFVLALGFGRTPAEAGHRARASLHDGFDRARANYIDGWQEWQDRLAPLEKSLPEGNEPSPFPERDLYRISTAVLRLHEAKHFRGGTIASLSIPWGHAKSDDDLGGYHLVWPRDMVETAGGLLAAGAADDVRRMLTYLQATQEGDGHWPQNMWLDGMPYWEGVQMDETAFPILLVDMASRENVLTPEERRRFWPMVRNAAAFLACNGPVTQEDRWEEDPGYSPFTLAVEIAALLAAADLAEACDDPIAAAYLRETADIWNASIESWTYVTGTPLARQVGVEGYYVRIAPPESADASSPLQGFVPVKNRPPGETWTAAEHLVSPDALALVRFGLRSPDDPRIVSTVKVIDALLRVETPFGPAWKRYNGDGYGENDDGGAFDGTGVGRPWPLLTGERAHYELAAGRIDEAVRLLRVMERFAGEGGLLPEQVWDGPSLPERELLPGRPTGSAMPLVWAHAEYIKLRRSLRDGRLFDLPPQPVRRYQLERQSSNLLSWRFNHKLRTMPAGRTLRVEVLAPATVRWTANDWQKIHDTETRDTGLGMFVADLSTASLPAGRTLEFTFHWPRDGRWEGRNFRIAIE